jgi:hypothetical protein
MIYKADGLHVHTTSWQDPPNLSELHIDEDFTYFLEKTMLSGFASRLYKTYAEISHRFLTTFRFAHTKEKVRKKGKNIPRTFDVKFFMKQQRFVMSSEEFCKAIDIQMLGVGKKTLVTLMNSAGNSGGA